MRKHILTISAVLIMFTTCGCGVINRVAMKKMRKAKPHMHMDASTAPKYDLKYFDNLTFEDTTSVEKINVQYQKGLANQADCIATQFDQLLSAVEDRVGIEATFTDINLKLIRTEMIPQHFFVCIPVDSNSITFPVWAEMGDESCQSILSRQSVYPYMLMHEIFEVSLIFPTEGSSVLMDFSWKANGLIKGKMRNYTRWFREGFANYAGFIASEIIADDNDLIASDKNWRYANYRHQKPLSNLAHTGTKLFKWDQFHKGSSNYDAALGLFLLIRNEHGEESIKNIAQQIKELENINGKALIKLLNEELNIDIVKRVKKFTFPTLTMKTKKLTPAIRINKNISIDAGLFVSSVDPNSLADKATLKKGDVIINVGGKDVTDNLTFELAMLDYLQKDSVPITIWRKDDGQLQLNLPLKNEDQ